MLTADAVFSFGMRVVTSVQYSLIVNREENVDAISRSLWIINWDFNLASGRSEA